MAKRKVAIVGYYHGPRLGIGIYINQLMSRLKFYQGSIGQVVFYTNKNTRDNLSSLDPNVKVVISSWLNAGSIPAIIFTAIIFPFMCLLRNIKIAVLLSNPIVLFRFIPTVSVIHDLNEFEVKFKYGVIRTFYRKYIMLKSAVGNSSRLIAVSGYTASQLKKYFPDVDMSRIHVIEQGVELEQVSGHMVDNVLTEHALSERGYFLIVGRIDPKGKSLYEAITLYSQLAVSNGPGGQKLVLVGGINKSSQEEADKFLRFIKEDNELSENVIYLGYISDQALAGLYSKATAVIFLSKNEGFGFPLIEAFSQGCPVIYNQSCRVLDEHAEGAGIGVSEDEISNGLNYDRLKVLYDPESRGELAMKMKSIAAKYNWERCATEYLELFSDMAEGKR